LLNFTENSIILHTDSTCDKCGKIFSSKYNLNRHKLHFCKSKISLGNFEKEFTDLFNDNIISLDLADNTCDNISLANKEKSFNLDTQKTQKYFKNPKYHKFIAMSDSLKYMHLYENICFHTNTYIL